MSRNGALKVVVCIKEVTYVYVPATIDRASQQIEQEAVVKIINPFDEYALEWALQIKKKTRGQAEVIVVTFGAPRVREMLSYCLSLGADQAYLIREDDFPTLDAWTRALVLSHGIRKMGFDVVFCGRKAVDDNLGLVGGYVAGFLNMPWLSNITYVDLADADRNLLCHKMAGKTTIEKVKVPLPALLMIERGGISLSYPSLPEISKSRHKAITELTGKDLALVPESLTGQKLMEDVRLTPPKPKPMFTIDSSLSAGDRLKMIMSGGIAKKTDSKLLEGKQEDIVPKVVQYLIDQASPF